MKTRYREARTERSRRGCKLARLSAGIALSLGLTNVGKALTLDEAIQRGMTRSPQVDQAQASVDAQIERKRAAWANIGPKASVTYNESRFDDKQVTAFGGQQLILRDDVTKNGSLTVTQPITGLYALFENGRLNGLQTDLSQEGLRKAKRDAGFLAADMYLLAYQGQEQAVIAEGSIAAAKSAFQDAEALQRVGRLNQGDLLKFQLALSQAAARAAQARANRSIGFESLKLAIRADEREEINLDKELPRLASVDPSDAPIADRPELKQAQLAAEISDFNIKLAYAKMLPTINVFAKWDRNFGEVTGLGGEKDVNYVGVSLQWDIWNNGSSIFEVREAVASRAIADAALASVDDAMRIEAVQARENYKAAKESIVLAESGVAQATEAYRIDQIRFKSGQITATDLIKSETDKSAAQFQLVAAQTELLRWHFKLQKALGKDQPQI